MATTKPRSIDRFYVPEHEVCERLGIHRNELLRIAGRRGMAVRGSMNRSYHADDVAALEKLSDAELAKLVGVKAK